ncbi:MAG TPA: amidase family protein [Vicinamibacterales bacterium]|nr:amidase family protein [Vicinamibacterales bacterium]
MTRAFARRGTAGTPLRLAVALLAAGCATVPPSPANRASGRQFNVYEAGIEALGKALDRGQVTSRQLVTQYLARIEAYDQAGPAINAFISLNPNALDAAAALDRERAAGRVRGPLHGIPIVVKDNYDTSDMPTTGGLVALATMRPPFDANQVARLRRAGAIIIGKTNLHELAAGIVTVSSLGGRTRNPYDPSRNPGGSSGGTGAAVAAGFAAGGMGTDTCGSIRIPAAHNNLVGLRPTIGLSSRSGIIPLSHTQDVAGPIARSVRDLAILLDATVAADPSDAVTMAPGVRRPQSFLKELSANALRGTRIGLLAPLFGDTPEDAEVGDVVRAAIERLKAAGAIPVELVVPDLVALMGNTAVIDFEFKFDLMDYLAQRRNAFVQSLGEILDRGLYHLDLDAQFRRRNATAERMSDAYRTALERREVLRRSLLGAMDSQRVAVAVYPPIRRKAARLGEVQGGGNNCQLSASTGLPALVMPAGFTADGFPVGIEFLGRPFEEPRLLSLGASMERLGSLRRAPASTPILGPDDQAELRKPSPAALRTPNQSEQSPAVTGTPDVKAAFTWDGAAKVLNYLVTVSGVQAGDMVLVALHRGEANQLGPVIAPLVRSGFLSASGSLPLRDSERDDLLAGRLYVRWYTRQQPLGDGRILVTPK